MAVTFLGTAGTTSEVEIPSRSSLLVSVPLDAPAAALVEARSGGLVAAQVALAAGAFAVSVGVPV